MEGVIEAGGDEAPETVEGDADRVEGALTAMESVVEATVDNEVVDPVRKREAASLGRAAVLFKLADVPAPFALAFILILAASWFRDGIRPLVAALCSCGASSGEADLTGADGAIVEVGDKGRERTACLTATFMLCSHFTSSLSCRFDLMSELFGGVDNLSDVLSFTINIPIHILSRLQLINAN